MLVRFLKDGANFLAKLVAEICNTSISSGFFEVIAKVLH